MTLHEENDIFNQYIMATADYMGLSDTGIVEKDYFVTAFLKRLVEKQPNIIFRGGTSLSKCYKLINRFSEDIDLGLNTGPNRPTEGQRKKLKQGIVSVVNELGFTLVNLEQVKSRKDFNRYIVDYMPVSEHSVLKQYLVVETAVYVKSFPIETMDAASFIYDFLCANNASDEITKYGLESFKVQVQSLERTFIDKVFAVGDYYLNGQSETFSRHIYDLYKIYPKVAFDDTFNRLVYEVRDARKLHKACLSAQDNINLRELLNKIIDEDFYKIDYNRITETLLFENVPYDEAILVLKQITKDKYFNFGIEV
jgi:predicted nucleotidyltransferase component of viral defense system